MQIYELNSFSETIERWNSIIIENDIYYVTKELHIKKINKIHHQPTLIIDINQIIHDSKLQIGNNTGIRLFSNPLNFNGNILISLISDEFVTTEKKEFGLHLLLLNIKNEKEYLLCHKKLSDKSTYTLYETNLNKIFLLDSTNRTLYRISEKLELKKVIEKAELWIDSFYEENAKTFFHTSFGYCELDEVGNTFKLIVKDDTYYSGIDFIRSKNALNVYFIYRFKPKILYYTYGDSIKKEEIKIKDICEILDTYIFKQTLYMIVSKNEYYKYWLFLREYKIEGNTLELQSEKLLNKDYSILKNTNASIIGIAKGYLLFNAYTKLKLVEVIENQ
jgi:hypothetical protein